MRNHPSHGSVARSLATSIVALLLLGGAVYATSDLLAGGARHSDLVSTAAEASPEPSESAGATEGPATGSPEPSSSAAPLATAEPNEQDELSEAAESSQSAGAAVAAGYGHSDQDGDSQGEDGRSHPSGASVSSPSAAPGSWSEDGGRVGRRTGRGGRSQGGGDE
jgi:hypothetical protein